MKEKDFLVIFIVALMLSISLTSLTYTYINEIETYRVPWDVNITTFIGFDIGDDALHFGALVPGITASSRKMNITNEKDMPINFILNTEGPYDENIHISPNNFVLLPNESKEIGFSYRAPSNLPLGFYEGYIRVTTKKARI